MDTLLRHAPRVAVDPELPDLRDASGAIGAENQPEKLGHEVVELAAGARVSELRAFGAGGDALVRAACAHHAPGGSRVLATTRAFPAHVGLARAAVQATAGNQFRLCLYFRHRFAPFLWWSVTTATVVFAGPAKISRGGAPLVGSENVVCPQLFCWMFHVVRELPDVLNRTAFSIAHAVR